MSDLSGVLVVMEQKGAGWHRTSLEALAAGQKLSYLNVTCAVGADNLIACLDTTSGDHGFVLQPSGSWAF